MYGYYRGIVHGCLKTLICKFIKHKKHVFHSYKKTLKTCIKYLNYSIHSSKKHRQYESNKVNNTATKHSLCPGNGVFAHEIENSKCIIIVILYVFVLTTTKNTTLKSTKTFLKKLRKHKNMFLNFSKKY